MVFRELARTLKPGARAVLDLGNARSLNAYSVRHYPDLAKQYFHTARRAAPHDREAGLVIVEHRAFQILPLWADRPGWLRPLLHRAGSACSARGWAGACWTNGSAICPCCARSPSGR